MNCEENGANEPAQSESTHLDPAHSARAAASLRMLGLAVGVIVGMVVGVALDSILLGATLGIGIGLGAAALLDRLLRLHTP